MTVKLKLKSKRVMKDYTQSDMAKMMGIQVPTYSRKENGSIRWSLDDVKKIKEILDLSGEEILDIFFS